MTSTGLFITFEGGEGGGKSTQIRMLAEALQYKGKDVVLTREPGGTEGAERIRALVVEGKEEQWDAVSETLLFLAARRDHVERVIKPALKGEKIVLCDRFSDSTFVYQGIGKKLGIAYVQQLQELAIGALKPDLTFLLDIAPEEGLKRASARSDNETRFEGMDMAFHTALRDGFLTLARQEPQRIRIVDAAHAPKAVHEEIMMHMKDTL